MAGQFHTTYFSVNSIADMYYRVLGWTLEICLKIVQGHLIIYLGHHSYIARIFLFLGSVRRNITCCVHHDVFLASPIYFVLHVPFYFVIVVKFIIRCMIY